MLQQISGQEPYDGNEIGRARLREPGRRFTRLPGSHYFSHVQLQPSAQLSQQLLSHLQSGQPSQQPLSLQQPLVQVAATGEVPANARTPVLKRTAVARDKIALVNMMKLTFWLM